MKNKTVLLQLGLALTFLLCSESAFAKGTPIGDIMLTGRVERAGQQLVSDTTLFEGDTIRTLANSGGVIRIGRGRLELDQSSEVEIVSEKPLKIAVNSGGLHFNFPVGTDFEIVTPQLDIHPTVGTGSYSGSITAQPKKEDRVTSRLGRYSILERQEGGAANAIHEGQVLIAALVMPALPQGGTATTIATIVQLDPPTTAQVNVARAAKPDNWSIRGTAGLTLANGDRVRSLQGAARIEFTSDKSVITLRPGTQVTIEERMQQGSLLRSISQYAGSLWFSIAKVASGGTPTRLSTPTAVAAIRGTEGENTDVPNVSTTFALAEGVEDLQENLTGSRVTIRSGQTVTAFRGVGFSAVTALIAAIGPSVGGAGPGGAGGGAGGAGGGGAGGAGGGAAGGGAGGGAGGAGGGAAGAGAGAATTTTTAAATAASTISTVATAAVGAVAPTTAALLIANNAPAPASASGPRTCPGNVEVCFAQ